MAKKRMFSLDVVDLDSFIEMPVSAKLLYYDLGMRADDDGFISSPKRITSMIGAGPDDLKLLQTEEYQDSIVNGIVEGIEEFYNI